MRRAVVAVIIMAAFTFVVTGPVLGHQPVAIGASLTADVRPAIKHVSLTAAVSVKESVKEKVTRAAVRAGKATAAKTVKTAEKTITYEGVQFRVPASWPVYYLNQDPDQCVRYDKNAVYVGTPGPAQDCPAGLIGRADTISIGDSDAPQGQTGQTAQVTPAQTEQRALLQGLPANDSGASQITSSAGQSTSSSVAPGTIFQNPNTHQFAVAMPASSPWINATYGTDPALVAQTLGSVRHIATQSAVLGSAKGAKSRSPKPKNPAWPKHVAPPTGFATSWIWPSPTTPPKTVSVPAAADIPAPLAPKTTPPKTTPPATTPPSTTAPKTTPTKTPAPKVTGTTAPGTVLADNPTPAPTATPQPTVPSIPKTLPASALPGFDTCTAPSLATMEAWKAKYSATAIYIGGQMVACDTGNLSSSWVEQTEAMGWSLMPTFVGLQAPCNSFSGKIDTKQAASQGTTAANQAIADAQSFGLNAGSPIYYDMEAYNNTNSSCRTAVLTFLDAWDRQLQAKGYVSGVYSSADAAMTDLQSTTTIAGHALDEPKAIWFALWDNVNNLTGSPYMNSSVWGAAARSKQFAGNKTVKVGSYTLSIDADWVDSPVARG
jgi:glycoside hydrolase-like protein